MVEPQGYIFLHQKRGLVKTSKNEFHYKQKQKNKNLTPNYLSLGLIINQNKTQKSEKVNIRKRCEIL